MQHCVCVSLQLVKLFNHLKKWLHLFSQGERVVVHRILLYLFTSDKEFGCVYQAIDMFCGFVKMNLMKGLKPETEILHFFFKSHFVI